VSDEAERARRGRPSAYTPEIGQIICERLAAGESLLSICRGDDMPPESTVRRWVLEDRDGFSASYARARDMQADHYADETIDIADNEEDAAKARVRIDARKWHASKVAPKKYGDKVALVGGGKGDEPIRMDLTGLTDEELAALEAIRSKLAIAGADQGGEGEAGG